MNCRFQIHWHFGTLLTPLAEHSEHVCKLQQLYNFSIQGNLGRRDEFDRKPSMRNGMIMSINKIWRFVTLHSKKNKTIPDTFFQRIIAIKTYHDWITLWNWKLNLGLQIGLNKKYELRIWKSKRDRIFYCYTEWLGVGNLILCNFLIDYWLLSQ